MERLACAVIEVLRLAAAAKQKQYTLPQCKQQSSTQPTTNKQRKKTNVLLIDQQPFTQKKVRREKKICGRGAREREREHSKKNLKNEEEEHIQKFVHNLKPLKSSQSHTNVQKAYRDLIALHGSSEIPKKVNCESMKRGKSRSLERRERQRKRGTHNKEIERHSKMFKTTQKLNYSKKKIYILFFPISSLAKSRKNERGKNKSVFCSI